MNLDEKCYWNKTVEYINQLPKDKFFRPIELKRFVYGEEDIKSTVGSYINFLQQTKFIEKISKGKYIRIKDIPDTLTTTKVYNYLYNNPLKERLDKLDQIKNNLENGEV
jgi:hypothetical protein